MPSVHASRQPCTGTRLVVDDGNLPALERERERVRRPESEKKNLVRKIPQECGTGADVRTRRSKEPCQRHHTPSFQQGHVSEYTSSRQNRSTTAALVPCFRTTLKRSVYLGPTHLPICTKVVTCLEATVHNFHAHASASMYARIHPCTCHGTRAI